MGEGGGVTVPSLAHKHIGMACDLFQKTENHVNRDEKEVEKLQKAFSDRLRNFNLPYPIANKNFCWYR